jgi:PAS domain S-box-containing protein
MANNLELWWLKRDGSQFPLEISLTLIIIKQKQVVLAFLIDISKRKKIEKK